MIISKIVEFLYIFKSINYSLILDFNMKYIPTIEEKVWLLLQISVELRQITKSICMNEKRL